MRYCRFLRDEGYSYPKIAIRVNCSQRQAQFACESIRVTPQKKKKVGRLPKLTPKRLVEVILWIQESDERRALNCEAICRILQLNVCGETLRLSLKARGMVPTLAT
jgi:hypothetical protein